jgi:hypothetical protein
LANSSLTIDDYKRYFTESGHEGFWDENEIKDILQLIPEEGLDANGELNGNVFGLLFGRYGFSAQIEGRTLGVIPKSLFELYLEGNQELFKEFSFDNFDGDGYSAVKLSLSLSHPIPFKKYFDEFGIGLNVNYYSGLAVAEVVTSEGSFVTTNEALVSTMNIVTRTGLGGSGLGFDLGAAGIIDKKWSASLVFKNLFAGLNWTKELEQHTATFVVDSIKIGDFEELDSLVTTETTTIGEFRTRLPVIFHLGVGYNLLENLTLALDLEQAFEDQLGYSDKAMLAVGAEYKPIGMIPLRAGMSFGGKWKYRFGVGVGFHLSFFHLDLAYAMHQGMWPTKTTGFSTAANIKLAF